MEKHLKTIGWVLKYPDSLSRLQYISDIFHEFYINDSSIPPDEIDLKVAFSMCKFTEECIYDIYVRIKDKNPNPIEARVKEVENYSTFIRLIEKTIPEVYKLMNQKVLIDLYLEYRYSQYIKGELHESIS
jgi:hypothetical protein